MGLSEREQRILDEIELSLAADGPLKVVSPNRRAVIRGAIVVLIGLALLLTAVVLPFPPLGVFAFVTMLTGTYMSIEGLPSRN